MTREKGVRVRFAPSPTGYLHIGGARTALYDWLLARKHGGQFILRIEDTDRKRYVPDALDDQMAGLRWLGLDWDEGPEVGGPYGPYIQSERQALGIYQQYAEQLVAAGRAYYCFCSPERLEEVRQERQAHGLAPGYDRHCRYLTPAEREAGIARGFPPVIRFAAPLEGNTTAHDLVRGEITVDNRTQDDFILLKSDGFPVYHLAAVVDDHLMRITHVIRGDEWLPSLPRHVMLYHAFGWELPEFVHLSIFLDPSGKGKMSKRKKLEGGGEYMTFIREFREEGYLPEAIINWLALMGWSPGLGDREIYSRQELIELFSLEGIHPSPAALNYDKAEWLNGVYIRHLDPDDLAHRLLPFIRIAGQESGVAALAEATFEQVRPLVPLVQERIKTLAEAPEHIDFFFIEPPTPSLEELVPKKMTAAETARALGAARETLAALPAFDHATIEEALRSLADRLGLKAGQLFTPIRVAVTGRTVAPPLFETLACLGREKALARIERAERELLDR